MLAACMVVMLFSLSPQNADLFHFLVKKLQTFLPRSANHMDHHKRTNEFE